MSKHTPGPWKQCPTDPLLIEPDVYGGHADGICAVFAPPERQKVAEHDARLIAAAPELLEACNQAATHYANLGPVLGDSDVAHDERMVRQAIHAAITKATA